MWYALRPHLIPFLKKLATEFELVLFTSAIAEYAEYFFELLNEQTNGALTSYLHREQCVNLLRNIFMKSLEVVTDRQPESVLLIDNSVLSFGWALENGVPVMSWNG